jgi:hypothetical protein
MIVGFNGTKYLTHRITYQSFYHDINPLYLTQEPNILNQTRKACALFFGMFTPIPICLPPSCLVISDDALIEYLLRGWAVGAEGHHSWSERDFSQYIVSINIVCARIHSDKRCECDATYWTELSSVEDLGGH